MPTTIPPLVIRGAWCPSQSSWTIALDQYCPSSDPRGHEGFSSRLIPKTHSRRSLPVSLRHRVVYGDLRQFPNVLLTKGGRRAMLALTVECQDRLHGCPIGSWDTIVLHLVPGFSPRTPGPAFPVVPDPPPSAGSAASKAIRNVFSQSAPLGPLRSMV